MTAAVLQPYGLSIFFSEQDYRLAKEGPGERRA